MEIKWLIFYVIKLLESGPNLIYQKTNVGSFMVFSFIGTFFLVGFAGKHYYTKRKSLFL
ncbi:hypothetical protein GCM10011391_39460 [Pullulanibacillus camelliae]|uniref:Uncharacterized protein n=1 Tax=Pullulanibacillus camelliae TaxID=1707096 RepID=A0A8J3E169_9BACL|nr:hypothetical protein [Pullulanibacillus camelliae]GGE56657.1 hypothetical protein GCM10011391_39460 [Pullulanibacillus camelliae]